MVKATEMCIITHEGITHPSSQWSMTDESPDPDSPQASKQRTSNAVLAFYFRSQLCSGAVSGRQAALRVINNTSLRSIIGAGRFYLVQQTSTRRFRGASGLKAEWGMLCWIQASRKHEIALTSSLFSAAYKLWRCSWGKQRQRRVGRIPHKQHAVGPAERHASLPSISLPFSISLFLFDLFQ